jgi:hypothetical protein
MKLHWLVAVMALTLGLSACTTKGTIKATTDPTTDILSSTSGKTWFTEEGLVREEYKVEAFTALNFENVKQDMAQGHGEYLASLGSLMGVSPAAQPAFFQFTRERYAQLIPSQQTTPAELVMALHREMKN